MSITEFFDRLERIYVSKNENYVDDYTEAFRRWGILKSDGTDGDRLKRLFEMIVDNHKHQHNYVPQLAEIKKLWEGTSRTEYHAAYNIHDLVRDWPAKRIVGAVNKLKQKAELKNIEMDFIHEYDVLAYVWSCLMEKGRSEPEAEAYCKKVIESIVKGERINVEHFHRIESKQYEEFMQMGIFK